MRKENFVNNFEEIKKEKRFFKPEEYLEILKSNEQLECLKVYEKVIEISETIKSEGGRSFLVGGSVRDIYFNKTPKDFDLEVYGLESSVLEEILIKFGKIHDVGKAFGILKVDIGGDLDIDVSLPRKDSKISEGHRGFAVETDTNMDTKDAAKRRDFTINSLLADPLTGEIIDHFGGLEDADNRVLKITDPERFKDDPLRVMRALQFVSRFGLKIDDKTSEVIKEMTPQLKELPKERLLEEWRKMLVKGDKPSLALMAGLQLGILKEIHPQFPPLVDVAQDKKNHPEGDVWIHTLMVVDEATRICRLNNLSEKDYFTIMLASLCHDLGKVSASKEIDGKIISYGHDKAGIEPSKEFLKTIGVDKETEDKVLKLVGNHMAPFLLYKDEVVRGNKVSDGAIKKLSDRIYPATIKDLIMLSMADRFGRGDFYSNNEKDDDYYINFNNYPIGEWLLLRARKAGVDKGKSKKLISGKDLISQGFSKPQSREEGIEFGRAIELGDRLSNLFEQLSFELDDLSLNFDKDKYFELIKDIKDIELAVSELKNKGIDIVHKIRKIRNKKIES